MLIAHIHEGLYWYIFFKLDFIYMSKVAKPTLLFMQIILYYMIIINLDRQLVEVIYLNHHRTLSTITYTRLVTYNLYQKYLLHALLRIVSTVILIAKLYCLNTVFMAFIATSFSNIMAGCTNFFLFKLAPFTSRSLESLPMLEQYITPVIRVRLPVAELYSYHYCHLIFKIVVPCDF